MGVGDCSRFLWRRRESQSLDATHQGVLQRVPISCKKDNNLIENRLRKCWKSENVVIRLSRLVPHNLNHKLYFLWTWFASYAMTFGNNRAQRRASLTGIAESSEAPSTIHVTLTRIMFQMNYLQGLWIHRASPRSSVLCTQEASPTR